MKYEIEIKKEINNIYENLFRVCNKCVKEWDEKGNNCGKYCIISKLLAILDEKTDEPILYQDIYKSETTFKDKKGGGNAEIV